MRTVRSKSIVFQPVSTSGSKPARTRSNGRADRSSAQRTARAGHPLRDPPTISTSSMPGERARSRATESRRGCLDVERQHARRDLDRAAAVGIVDEQAVGVHARLAEISQPPLMPRSMRWYRDAYGVGLERVDAVRVQAVAGRERRAAPRPRCVPRARRRTCARPAGRAARHRATRGALRVGFADKVEAWPPPIVTHEERASLSRPQVHDGRRRHFRRPRRGSPAE